MFSDSCYSGGYEAFLYFMIVLCTVAGYAVVMHLLKSRAKPGTASEKFYKVLGGGGPGVPL